MISGFQPNTSASLAWNGRTELLSETNLAANPSGLVTTDNTGKLEVATELPATAIPPSIEVTGDLTGANLIGQTAAIQTSMTVPQINNAILPTLPTAQACVWVREVRQVFNNIAGGQQTLTLATGVSIDEVVSVSVWYDGGGGRTRALEKQAGNTDLDNRWAIVDPLTGQINVVYYANLAPGSTAVIAVWVRAE